MRDVCFHQKTLLVLDSKVNVLVKGGGKTERAHSEYHSAVYELPSTFCASGMKDVLIH